MTTLRLIGYWGKGSLGDWPDPRNFVDPSWNRSEHSAVLQHLRNRPEFAMGGAVTAGFSRCRICDVIDGAYEYTDGAYLWPQGLAHYVEVHDVRLPEEFVAHVLAQEDAPRLNASELSALEQEASVDHGWWKQMRTLDFT